MLAGIDPVTIVTTIIAVIGIVATFVTSTKAKRYIRIIQRFLNIVSTVLKAKSDGSYTDEEFIAIGKATVEFTDNLNNDETLPVEYKQV